MTDTYRMLALIPAGLALGAAGALSAQAWSAQRDATAQEETSFVSAGTIPIPLVLSDGRLGGYVDVTSQVEVSRAAEPDVRKRMPLMLDAVNMRAFQTPLARIPDGQIPRLDALRRMMQQAAVATFGRAAVRRVVIVRVSPA